MKMRIEKDTLILEHSEPLTEEMKVAFQAGQIYLGQEIIREMTIKAKDEYKTEDKYIDDFSVSIRDIKQIIERAKI